MDEFEKLARASGRLRLADPQTAETVRATLRLLRTMRMPSNDAPGSNALFVERFQRDALAAIDTEDWPRLARVMLNLQNAISDQYGRDRFERMSRGKAKLSRSALMALWKQPALADLTTAKRARQLEAEGYGSAAAIERRIRRIHRPALRNSKQTKAKLEK